MLRAHPKVLEVPGQIYANHEYWAGTLDTRVFILTFGS
jgi:hypothetical protein